MREFNTMRAFIFVAIGLVFLLIIGMIFFRVNMVMDATKKGKTVYEVNVNTFKENEVYITTEYTRDKETGCIKFKDEFGIKHVVCNNYTITEF